MTKVYRSFRGRKLQQAKKSPVLREKTELGMRRGLHGWKGLGKSMYFIPGVIL